MITTRIFRHPEFRNMFSSYLDSDLIDAEDREDILDRAETITVRALLHGVPAEEIIEALEFAQSHWGPEVIEELEVASNFPWSSSAYREALLRSVVEEMLGAAKAAQGNVSAAEKKAS